MIQWCFVVLGCVGFGLLGFIGAAITEVFRSRS